MLHHTSAKMQKFRNGEIFGDYFEREKIKLVRRDTER